MFRLRILPQHFLPAGALGIVALLCALGLAPQPQARVQVAHADGPALRRTLVGAATPQAFARQAAARKQKENNGSEPWTNSEVLQPTDLAKNLSDPKSKKPAVVCVGFEFLYREVHIPAAEFHGPAATAEGIENLKKWAETIPRSRPVVLYCGCCPWTHCPNIRPAFKALHNMGFKQLKVLAIPADFGTDWVQKGLPVQRGS